MYLSQVRPLPLSRPRSVRGERPQVYAWAGIEQLQIKYEASSSLLTLKFRTFMAGGGLPHCQPKLVAYARGEAPSMPTKQEEMEDILAMVRAQGHDF